MKVTAVYVCQVKQSLTLLMCGAGCSLQSMSMWSAQLFKVMMASVYAAKLYASLIGWLPAAQMGWSARTQSPLNSHEGLLNSSRPAYVAAAGMTALRAFSSLMTKSCACQAVNTKHS